MRTTSSVLLHGVPAIGGADIGAEEDQEKYSFTADHDTQTLPGHFSDMNHDRDLIQTEETISVVKWLHYQHTGELFSVLEKNSCKVLKIHLLSVSS